MIDPGWRELQGAIAGDVVLADSPQYDAARKPAIPRFGAVEPQAVVRCATASDVAETLALVKRAGVPIAVRSGGHCFAGRSSTTGVVLDVTPMSSISVSAGTATVGAGTRLGALYDHLQEHGVTIPGGCGPSVGIAGLTMGGGLGILGRAQGLTCDHLVGARVVLADGRVVDCDGESDADLFWALRGAGGGNFGVVTSLSFRTLATPMATGFHLVWPAGQAASVVRAWQRWLPRAPEEIAASVLVAVPADIQRPAEVNVFGAMTAGAADCAQVLGGLVAGVGADPASTVYTHDTFRETKRYLAQLFDEGAEPRHDYSKSEFFKQPLAPDTVAALVDGLVGSRAPGQGRELDFSPWGGAYNRMPSDATAFPHRAEMFLLKQAASVDARATDTDRRTARGWLRGSWALVHPYGSGGVYPNFPDPELADPGTAYWGANYPRLRRVKARYDLAGLFRYPQSVSVAAVG